MGYRNIAYGHITHPVLNKVFRHADAFLYDCYGMFQLPVTGRAEGGACNFSIVLILLCVIDGIATEVYPTGRIKDQKKRFKKVIRDKLCWGPVDRTWIDKSEAANLLYLEYRNPLVHELGREKASRVRRRYFVEPIVSKWDRIPAAQQDIDYVDSMEEWDDRWPTLHVQSSGGKEQMRLCAASLYWSVKQMVKELAADSIVINEAEKHQDSVAAAAPRNLLTDLVKFFCPK